MKTIKLFYFITLFTLITSNAQITKGNWLMGGNGNISYTKSVPKQSNSLFNSVESEILSISLEPNVGYFFINKLAGGLKISAKNSFVTDVPFEINQTQLSISPFLRYYFLEVEKPYNIFVEPSYYKYTYKPLGMIDAYGVKFGHVYFLNSSVGIETSINYVKTNGIDSDSKDLFLGFGFQLYLEKK